MIELEARLRFVQRRIEAAAYRAERKPSDVRLVAVTKMVPIDQIAEAYRLGLRHFGESRADEAAEKVRALPRDICWHMIGHVQSRKARQVVELVHVVQSLDSVRLAERLDRLSAQRAEPLSVLLQVNVSGEVSKSGLRAARWSASSDELGAAIAVVERVSGLPHLRLEGLMTIAPVVADADDARPIFASLRRLRDELRSRCAGCDLPHLSMGMTDDFEVAIEEGATIVRVGRAIFGPEARAGQPAPAPEG